MTSLDSACSQVMRAALERGDVEVVAYNDPFIDPDVSVPP